MVCFTSTIERIPPQRRPRRDAGFSLIELLVVIAITLVLIGLLFGPLVTGFRLTSQAQATTQAQDAARVAMEQISREIGSAAAVRDTSGQHLNLLMYTHDSTGAIDEVVAHAYDSYIDIVPPHAASSGTGTVADPTVNPYDAAYRASPGTGGANVLTGAGVGLPLAPGATIIRYFVGLRHPLPFNYVPGGTVAAQEQPYTNRDEGQTFPTNSTTYPSGAQWGTTDTIRRGINNPYILYRAQVSVYKTDSSGHAKVNNNFFAASDTDNTKPVLDDPDFFRVTGDAQHNARVYYWYQAAKPIIDLTDINLVYLPHDGSGKIVYQSNGYPAGTTTEPDTTVSSGISPIIRTSVTFGPGSVSNDALSPTAGNDTSQGYGTAPTDASAPYLPSLYRAQYGQWHGGPNLLISEPGGNNYRAAPFSTGQTTVAAADLLTPNDLIEDIPGSQAVYNVSTNMVLNNAASFVAMTVNGDSGTVNFALPDGPIYGTDPNAMPHIVPKVTYPTTGTLQAECGSADSGNVANPYWYVTFGPGYGPGSNGDTTAGAPTPPLEIHLAPLSGSNYDKTKDAVLLPNAPIATGGVMPNAIPNITAANARVVINSERVYGPEQDSTQPVATAAPSGQPASYPLVPYRRVSLGDPDTIGPDQYMIDYATGKIYLGKVTNIDLNSAYPQQRTFLVAYSYQNNCHVATGTPATVTADTVRASYQTGSRVQVSVGIRLYDVTNQRPTYYSLTNSVNVGNAAR